MTTKRISQREARRLRKRVEELERQDNRRRNAWANEYPGGVNIGSVTLADADCHVIGAIHAARLLKHAVVVTRTGGTINFFALPLAQS